MKFEIILSNEIKLRMLFDKVQKFRSQSFQVLGSRLIDGEAFRRP